MFSMIRTWLRPYQRRRALASIRENMEFFGYPMDGMSDDDIEKWAEELRFFFANAAITPEEFERANEIFLRRAETGRPRDVTTSDKADYDETN